MKLVLVIILFSFQISFAAEAHVFCKDASGIKNILQNDGWECRDLLMEVGNIDANEACFTGKRAQAMDVLNSLSERGYFDGTDGMSIQNAKYKGRDAITYTVLDDTSDESYVSSMSRCMREFFQSK